MRSAQTAGSFSSVAQVTVALPGVVVFAVLILRTRVYRFAPAWTTDTSSSLHPSGSRPHFHRSAGRKKTNQIVAGTRRALLVSPLREHARQPTKRIERDRCDEPLQGSNQDLLVDELAHEPQGDAEQSQDRPDQGDDRSPPSRTATHFHGPQPPGPERLRTRLAVRRGLRVRRLTTEDAHLRGGEAGVFLLPRPM
jgi:hypothetical protein